MGGGAAFAAGATGFPAKGKRKVKRATLLIVSRISLLSARRGGVDIEKEKEVDRKVGP